MLFSSLATACWPVFTEPWCLPSNVGSIPDNRYQVQKVGVLIYTMKKILADRFSVAHLFLRQYPSTLSSCVNFLSRSKKTGVWGMLQSSAIILIFILRLLFVKFFTYNLPIFVGFVGQLPPFFYPLETSCTAQKHSHHCHPRSKIYNQICMCLVFSSSLWHWPTSIPVMSSLRKIFRFPDVRCHSC